MNTLDDVRADLLKNDRAYAVPMLDAIAAQVENDSEYAEAVALWLGPRVEGQPVYSSVHLRDVICDRFRTADFVLAIQGSLLDGKHPYAFDDMWMSVDSARHHLDYPPEDAERDAAARSDAAYSPAPGHEGELPKDLHTAHVRHDDEVWTDSETHVCTADSFDMAKHIAALLRHDRSRSEDEA